ncbi:MAG TPA: non-canonical purine NTP pyrophosphatase [Candidatus Dormibacteraeota bacterium]|nr:non-canonical purine NTP pyrophosphatase [Candidatus Dormibacteraeota bacterium]
MSDLLLATTNRGKQREFARLLAGVPARVVTPQDLGLELDVPEPHDTYAENAIAKADAYCRASGLPTLADDSGLEAAALDWGPGVRTGRFGGPDVDDRVGHLLAEIEGAEDRRARMVCWLALAVPPPERGAAAGEMPQGDAPRIELFHGAIEGSVARERRGDGGFGYDPVFELPSGMTTAQLPDGEKDRISHRGRAVAAAMPRLRELFSSG